MPDEAPRPLSLAMVSDDFLPAVTGVGIHVQAVTRELARRGHTVTVLTSRRRGQPARETWNGVRVVRVFSIPVFGFYQALPLASLLRRTFMESSVDVIHFHYISVLMLRALRVARLMGLPTVYTAHMTVDHLTQPSLLKPFRGLFTRLILHLLGRFGDVIGVSLHQTRQISHFNIYSRLHHVPNPIDFDGSEAAPKAPSGKFTVLFVGRLNPEKNVAYLIRAFTQLAKERPQVELLIAGQGSEETALKEMVKIRGLEKTVRFLGQVDHNRLPDLYAQCDVFVLPSLVETQGMVALEAMRFSRPVIVTERIVSAQELVQEGENGFIVDPDRDDALGQALLRLHDDGDLRRRMGRASRQRSEGYTGTGIADRLEAIYRAAVDNRRPATAPRGRFEDRELVGDRRNVCVLCQLGLFSREMEHQVIGSNARSFQEEYFAVWRCPVCRSLHSLPRIPMEDYYRKSPFLKRGLNSYNRKAFSGFERFLRRLGTKEDDRILLYGINARLFEQVFREAGYTHFDGFEGVPSEKDPSTPEAIFDTVVILDYLERVDEPRQVLDFAARELRPGGMLVIHTPDAEVVHLDRQSTHQLHQPYRVHLLSRLVLVSLAEARGFRLRKTLRWHYLDTWWPFVNYRAFHDLSGFTDGTLDSAFAFQPSQIWKKWWRLPKFFFLAFFGRIYPDRANLVAIFEKTS